jgi:hypothetical protein
VTSPASEFANRARDLDAIGSATYALDAWGCPNGALRFRQASFYDIYYVAEP